MAGNRFPHLTGATDFPHASTIDVYRYENTFDYNRWPSNVELTLCNVPWCGDYENTVKFEDDAARDAWFDGLPDTETIALDTMRHILPEQSIKLPVPIGVMQHFNYLMVKMPRFTSDGEPIEHADGTWKERYFYFVDNAVERAGSTTECVLRCDYWTTYINDLTFDYAMLARGHAPVAATDVADYLREPISNSEYLLAPDVTFADARIAKSGAEHVYNRSKAEQWFVLLSNVRLTDQDDWGTLSEPKTPAGTMCEAQTVPAPHPIAVDVDDARSFVEDIAATAPQFLETVKGAFFIDKSLTFLASEHEFCGHKCWYLSASQESAPLLDITQDDFGYPVQARGFAKLYTSPYAHIEVSDMSGKTRMRVRVEDTTGSLTLLSKASLAFPWIAIDAGLAGVGGEMREVVFANNGTGRYAFQGVLGEYAARLDVPVFSISQSAASYANYKSDYDRAQARLSADNALASALASNATANTNAVNAADTANTNAVNSANTARTNASNSASNIVSNNAVAVAANSSKTSTSNAAAFEGVGYANDHQDTGVTFDINSMSASYLAERDGLAVAATNNDMRAATSVIGGIASTVGSLATGDIAGAISGVSSLAGSGVSWATTNASIAVSQSNAETIYQASVAAAHGKTTSSQSASSNATAVQTTAASALTAIDNNASTSIASNNASLINTNAENTRDTAVGNANRTESTAVANANRTKATADANARRAHDTAIAAIAARLNQAGVDAPREFGERRAGETAVTRPLGIVAQVVTQPDGAIMQAAAQFARYGYRLDQQWRIERLQVMRHFTYWECPEVWCAGDGNAVEVAQQAVKDIMERGVTVWSVPEEIGRVSVYDN